MSHAQTSQSACLALAEKLNELREAGVGYVLINDGGSGGGARGRESLRCFAREVMPAFAREVG